MRVQSTMPVETVVKAIWRDVLDVESANLDDNLFDVGGTSLSAMRIASRLQETFCVGVSMDAILREGTVLSVVRAVEALLDAEPSRH